MADPLTDLLAAVAARLATVEGIASATYPAPDRLEFDTLPAIVVFPGSPRGESVIVRNTGGVEIWELSILIRLYGPRVGDTQAEFAAIDRLIYPVIRAFHAPPRETLPDLGFHVDRFHIAAWQGAVNVPYAGAEHYGAEFYPTVKFRIAGA